MSGTAFDGSPWLTALEIGGLVVLSFGGAAVGATLMRVGLEKSLQQEFEASQVEAAQKMPSTKRRRYAANAELAAKSEDAGAEALAVPKVVEDVEQESAP